MRNDCVPCPGCQEYYCTWCGETKLCKGCGQQLCESCQDDFYPCEGCKKEMCLTCTDDFTSCDESEACSFTACETCMGKHECKTVEKEELPKDD